MFVSIHQIYCLDQSEDANNNIKQDNKKTNDNIINSNGLAMTFHYNELVMKVKCDCSGSCGLCKALILGGLNQNMDRIWKVLCL